MEPRQNVKRLLDDFVFGDSRLADHRRVRASLFWREGDAIVRIAEAPHKPHDMAPRLLPGRGVAGVAWARRRLVFLDLPVPSEPPLYEPTGPEIRRALALPLLEGENVLGVLTLDSPEREAINLQHLGLAQLLGALLLYARTHSESNARLVSPSSIALGQALKKVREEVGLTQAELAERINESRIALSRWEGGGQPPSFGPLYDWCRGVGLVSSTTRALVTVVEVTPSLLRMLKEDPRRLHQLSPSQFEQFVAERIDHMGFDVTLTGATLRKDGGIDLIATPKVRTVGAFLLAGQVKHHRGQQKTGRGAVDRLLAWKGTEFRLGLLVTNTDFTSDARWVAARLDNRPFLRLRYFEDLKRWIEDNFSSEEEWREIPDEIDLAPGIRIAIPKPKLRDSLEIWPLKKLEISKL